jgi:hypothetical protein
MIAVGAASTKEIKSDRTSRFSESMPSGREYRNFPIRMKYTTYITIYSI